MKKQSTSDINNLGKIPPQAIEIEEAILGALMLEKDSILNIPFLKTICFYKDSHQKIFESIKELSKQNLPIDLLTVTERLKINQALEEIGGQYYLSQLTNKIASAANIEYHGRVVFEKFIQREYIRISNEINTRAYDSSIDLSDLIETTNSDIEQVLSGIYNNSQNTWYENIKESIKKLEERYTNFKNGKTTGIITPINKLNKYTAGWQPGDVIIVAARPSMGKTAFAIECMTMAAKSGFKPLYFSLEMSSVKITNRILIGESGVNANDFRIGNLSSDDYKKLDRATTKIESWNLIIDDSSFNFDEIRTKARLLHKKNQCDFIIIDYLQLIKYEGKAGVREQEVSELSRNIKLLAKSLNIPIMALAQLNRACEARPGKRPILSDLRESGSIEQDADIVSFIHRAYQYGVLQEEDENNIPYETKGIGEIIIAKQRDGDTGTIKFKHNESLTKIFDYDSFTESYSKTVDVDRNHETIRDNSEFDVTPNREFETQKYEPF